METRVLACDERGIAAAATRLAAGALVAVPTETVYGLAANALDPDAVARIYAAKGRPADNPLIVHVGRRSCDWARLAAAGVVADISETAPLRVAAERLMRAFWPGPLTLVLPKGDRIPSVVTAGHASVGVRMPDHASLLALLAELPFPLAAPSANRSNRISPTRADDVMKELRGRIPLVLDGGVCKVGVESTIVAVEADGGARLLRPGGLPIEAVEALLGSPLRASRPGARVAPGMGASHYAPRRPVVLVSRFEAPPASALAGCDGIGLLLLEGGAVCPAAWRAACGAARLTIASLADDGDGRRAAKGLFAALRALDEAGVQTIVAELPRGAGGAWPALLDRLCRAAAPRDCTESRSLVR